jgi:hypothetical protein
MGLLLEGEGLYQRGRDQFRLGQWRQADEPHAINEISCQLSGNGDGKAGLADAARPSDGQQTYLVLLDRGADSREVIIPADERGEWDGEMLG